jgi:hypothetical protein
MIRRELLGALGAGAVGLTALAARADEKAADSCCQLDKTHEDCLKACGDCAKACDMTFNHCFTMVAEGKKEHAKSMRLLGDCAGFCGLSACMIAKQSPLMAFSCGACADACAKTAAEVERFDDSGAMSHAAKALRACEKSCRSMVVSMSSPGTAGRPASILPKAN